MSGQGGGSEADIAAAFGAALAGYDTMPAEIAGAGAAEEPEAQVAPAPREARAMGYSARKMNREWALVLMGSKAVILREQAGSAPVEDAQRFLTREAFCLWLGNTYTEVMGADGKIKGRSWADRWLVDPDRRSYSGIEFFPCPDGAKGCEGYYNLWRGFAVTPKYKKDGWSILADHLLNNVCDGDADVYKWVLGWFAHIVQRPRERTGTAIVMQGAMGAGKSKVGEVMGSLFPAHFFMVDDPRYVTGNFNAHMASCLLLQAEEAVWAGDKAAEGRLKGLTTSEYQMIEAKGVDPIRLKNYVRLLMTSNEDWVVPAGKDERRFCVLKINPRCAQNSDYFREMDEQLNSGGREALLYDLMHYDLAGINLRKIPRTPALLDQKLASLDSVDQWWYGRLWDGDLTQGGRRWGGSVPFSTLYADYLAQAERVGWRRRTADNAMGKRLRQLVEVDGLKVHRTRDYDPEAGQSGRRVWMLDFPPLADCRAAWDATMGQADDWPDDGAHGG